MELTAENIFRYYQYYVGSYVILQKLDSYLCEFFLFSIYPLTKSIILRSYKTKNGIINDVFEGLLAQEETLPKNLKISAENYYCSSYSIGGLLEQAEVGFLRRHYD